MVIYGAGEHGKVVYDCLGDNQVFVETFFDDNPNVELFYDKPVFRYSPDLYVGEDMIIAIGSNRARKKAANSSSHRLVSVVHKSCVVSKGATIDTGSMIMQGAIIQIESKIGRCVIVNTGATVDHDCTIGDFAHIAPNSTLCGNVSIGEGTLVGAGSVIVPGIKVGKWSVIGAGSVIIDDVPDHVMVAGNPGRIIKNLNN